MKKLKLTIVAYHDYTPEWYDDPTNEAQHLAVENDRVQTLGDAQEMLSFCDEEGLETKVEIVDVPED